MENRKRILVIDDNQALVSTTEKILRDHDFEVITALTGAEGYDRAKQEKPDVIILDAIIPGIRGHEVGRQLKQDNETSDIPIIILGTEEDVNSKERISGIGQWEISMAFECGASDFLQKPVSAGDLVRSVKNVLWFSMISALA